MNSRVRILKGISFEVKKNECVAIVGSSGVGKSTLLQIIGLLDDATSGNITIGDVACADLSENEKTIIRRQSIGFVYQMHYLLPEFTVIENLMIPQLINRSSSEEARANGIQFLQKISMQNKANDLITQLSGGEQQRVAILRSMVTKPKLILADEPTGNLDQENSDLVFEFLIHSVKQNEGVAVIVTHDMDLARKTDRVLHLHDGILSEITL